MTGNKTLIGLLQRAIKFLKDEPDIPDTVLGGRFVHTKLTDEEWEKARRFIDSEVEAEARAYLDEIKAHAHEAGRKTQWMANKREGGK